MEKGCYIEYTYGVYVVCVCMCARVPQRAVRTNAVVPPTSRELQGSSNSHPEAAVDCGGGGGKGLLAERAARSVPIL